MREEGDKLYCKTGCAYDTICVNKRKKTATVIPSKTVKSQPAPPGSQETQFWVCPHCGRDTEYKNGKQFCGSCKTYL